MQAIFAGARVVTLSEGEISELHVGLRGTMGALFLKDLAQKTHRGQEGRVRKGRAIGRAPFGYRVARSLDARGELERGLRDIEAAEASVVRRIFAEYDRGLSPLAIAKALNAEGIPGPAGGIWYADTLRGRASKNNGLLRNALYVGKLVWNRVGNLRDPVSGRIRKRAKQGAALVESEVPDLRIIAPDVWERVQERLARESAPRGPRGPRYWECRRPKTLLTGKVVCGVCGNTFTTVGQDYLRCRAAKQGSCGNPVSIRRGILQEHVLDVLGRQLMDPDLVAEMVGAFTVEWNRLAAEATATHTSSRREIEQVERKIANLLDLASEGVRSPGLAAKLEGLERQLLDLRATADQPVVTLPVLHPNLAHIYRDKVALLREALDGPDAVEAIEASRPLINRIVISPPKDDGNPPGIEIEGELLAMLKAGGLASKPSPASTQAEAVLTAFTRSIKADTRALRPWRGPGAEPLALLTS